MVLPWGIVRIGLRNASEAVTRMLHDWHLLRGNRVPRRLFVQLASVFFKYFCAGENKRAASQFSAVQASIFLFIKIPWGVVTV